jgi:hypothetical protein
MSKEIADPFKLLASLWSMVPAVEDQKPQWGIFGESAARLAAEKAASSAETKSTNSGSGSNDETPPGSSRK